MFVRSLNGDALPDEYRPNGEDTETYIDFNCSDHMAQTIQMELHPVSLVVDEPRSPGYLFSTNQPPGIVLLKLNNLAFVTVATNTVGVTTVSTLGQGQIQPFAPNPAALDIFVRNSMIMEEFQVGENRLNRVAKKAFINTQTCIDCNGNGRLAWEIPNMRELQPVTDHVNQANLFSTPKPPYVVLDALEARGFRVVEAKTEVDGVTTVWTLRRPMA